MNLIFLHHTEWNFHQLNVFLILKVIHHTFFKLNIPLINFIFHLQKMVNIVNMGNLLHWIRKCVTNVQRAEVYIG